MSELIAEARVLVTPDTTQFRTLLETQLAAITKTIPPVPVAVAPVISTTAASAQAAQVAGARAVAESAERITLTAGVAAQAQAQLARSADLVAVAERRAAAASTEVGAAQIRYGAAISATQATQKAYQLSLETTDALLIKSAADAAATARANEALALSNLEVARTEAAKTRALTAGSTAQAASLAQTSRGAGSAALSLVGLRGATLAATGPFLAGAAAASAFAKSVSLATSFNSEIAVLGAVTGATGQEMQQAAEAAKQFGRDITLPGVSAGQAAQTITEFSKAGLSLNESIAATRGGLQLAQAAQLSYADAVTLSANALNAFNLSGDQAVHVADVLANASNLAQGSIADVGLALRQSAAAAKVVGVSFEDTVALLTILAQNGLTASDAGTSLRTAFIRLVNPSKAAQKILSDLNVTLRDVDGNVRPEVFQEFAQAQRDLTVAQQQANAAVVFGQDAFRVIGILGGEAPGALAKVQKGLEQTGTAARIAQARMSGLRGASENLQNQLGDLGLEVGELADGPLTIIVKKFSDYVGVVGQAIKTTENFATAIKNIVPPAPPGLDQPGRDDDPFGVAKRIFGFTNPITGIGSPIGQLKRFNDLFGGAAKETADEARKSGVEIRGGIEDASRAAAAGADQFLKDAARGIGAGFDQINTAIREGVAKARAAQIAAVGAGAGQQSGLEEVFNQIVAGGGSAQAQVANLKRQAAVQARIIAKAGPDAAGVLLEARREAQAKLASINSQITGIEKQIAADAKAAQDEQQRVREDAKRERDQNFLQAQQDARTAAERRVTLAEDTPQLTDDIRRQEQLRALIQKQIAAIRASALDEKTKQAAIRDLVKASQQTTDELKRLHEAQRQQQEEQRQAIFDRTAENAALRTQIAEARDADKSVIVRFIDQEIAIAQAALRRAKQAGKGILAAQLAVEDLKKKKRDLLKEAQDEAGDSGTSVLDLLRQNAETFNATAGNLVTGNQPFAGPTGFTADIAQFLHARPQGATITVQQKPAPSTDELQRQVNEQLRQLILALEANTAAQGGNSSTFSMKRYTDVTGARANAMAQFYLSRQARQLTEAENQ